jgi:hypothetical protein
MNFILALMLALNSWMPQHHRKIFSGVSVAENGTGYFVGSGTSQTITPSSGVGSGSGVIAVVQTSGNHSGFVSSATDNGSGGANTWTCNDQQQATTNFTFTLCSAYIAHSITTITFTTSNFGIWYHVYVTSPFATSSWTDVGNHNSGTGTSLTVTAGGSVTATDTVFAIILGYDTGGDPSISTLSGYTMLNTDHQDSGSSRYFSAGWMTVASGTPAATATAGTSVPMGGLLEAYKQ